MVSIENSAGAVVFLKRDNEYRFLLLHYVAGHWDLPKGHIEGGETLKDTVIREIKEETGIDDLKFIPGFQEKIEYFFTSRTGETIFKTNRFFLAETKEDEINLSSEHTDFIWLPYQQAFQKMTFKKAKNVLKKAFEFLKSKD